MAHSSSCRVALSVFWVYKSVSKICPLALHVYLLCQLICLFRRPHLPQNLSSILCQWMEECSQNIRLPKHRVLVPQVFDGGRDEEEEREDG